MQAIKIKKKLKTDSNPSIHLPKKKKTTNKVINPRSHTPSKFQKLNMQKNQTNKVKKN